MHILIIGAAGMVGRKLAERLGRDGTLGGKPITQLAMVDMVKPVKPLGALFKVTLGTADVARKATAARLIATRPDVIFHLAAIVSGEAEQNFDKGYAINLDGSRFLFEAIRQEGLKNGPYHPRVVFTSSIAVFGAPFHDKITDEFFTTPLTSYGTQKAIGELLLCDYTRKGFFDGIALRLPTICVRPGKPNLAASGFFSNIIREPLVGQSAILPVKDDVRHWVASPRAGVGFMLHAATMNSAKIGSRRALTLPGISVTVAEQIEALRRVAGSAAVAHIKHQPDPAIMKIVSGWPRNFDAARAVALGFVAEASFDEIIKVHIADELGGRAASN